MSINTRAKARRGRQEFLRLCKARGVSQFPHVHIHVVRCERLRLEQAMDQARQGSTGSALPAVAHRTSGQPWKITMELPHWLELYAGYLVSRQTPAPDPISPEDGAYLR